MSTVLVPLDETGFAESILPDAQQLAGPGGRLVLVYVVARRGLGRNQSGETGDAERYLTNGAQLLQAHGFQVATKVLVGGDIPRAIDEGVTELGAEMVAVATHGMGGGRLARSSIAWKTLAHSPVPILLRHVPQGRVRDPGDSGPRPVTIMVPLDGSPTAERLSLPIVVIPSLAELHQEPEERSLDETAMPGSSGFPNSVSRTAPVARSQMASSHAASPC